MSPWDGVLTPEEGDAIHAYLISIPWDAYKAQQAAQSIGAATGNSRSSPRPGRNLPFGAFAVAHEPVALHGRRHSNFARLLDAAPQYASPAANADRPRLGQFVWEDHHDLEERVRLQSLRQVEIQSARTHLARFGRRFPDDTFVGPTNRQRQAHDKTPRCTSFFYGHGTPQI